MCDPPNAISPLHKLPTGWVANHKPAQGTGPLSVPKSRDPSSRGLCPPGPRSAEGRGGPGTTGSLDAGTRVFSPQHRAPTPHVSTAIPQGPDLNDRNKDAQWRSHSVFVTHTSRSPSRAEHGLCLRRRAGGPVRTEQLQGAGGYPPPIPRLLTPAGSTRRTGGLVRQVKPHSCGFLQPLPGFPEASVPRPGEVARAA